jgi:hypothetical protein
VFAEGGISKRLAGRHSPPGHPRKEIPLLNTLKSALAGVAALAALVATGEFSPSHAQLQSFNKVSVGIGQSATGTFTLTFGQAVPAPVPIISSVAHQWFNVAAGTGRYLDSGSFTVTMGRGTATTQQVILNGGGVIYNQVGSKTVGKPVPIKVTIVVNLTAARLPLPAGAPPGSTANAATMTFKAVNATTGAPIVTTGVLKGYTLAAP